MPDSLCAACVLCCCQVVWSLPGMSRNYLPRLGGPIRAIAPSTADPARYAPQCSYSPGHYSLHACMEGYLEAQLSSSVPLSGLPLNCSVMNVQSPCPLCLLGCAYRFCISQTDNTVRLVNTATMRVEASIHGLRPPPPAAALAAAGYGACCSAASSSPAGVVQQPLTGHVVLPAEHATLQFFDMNRDRHIARLQVGVLGWLLSTPTTQVASGRLLLLLRLRFLLASWLARFAACSVCVVSLARIVRNACAAACATCASVHLFSGQLCLVFAMCVQVSPRNPVVTAPTSQAAAAAAAAGLDVSAALVPSVVLAGFTADSSSLVTVDLRPSTSGEHTAQYACCALGRQDSCALPSAAAATSRAPFGEGSHLCVVIMPEFYL